MEQFQAISCREPSSQILVPSPCIKSEMLTRVFNFFLDFRFLNLELWIGS